MIAINGYSEKLKCSLQNGSIKINDVYFPIYRAKKIEDFKNWSYIFSAILLIIIIKLGLVTYSDINKYYYIKNKLWPLFVFIVVSSSCGYLNWIILSRVKYRSMWIINGSKTLFIEKCDDSNLENLLLNLTVGNNIDSEVKPDSNDKNYLIVYGFLLVALFIAAIIALFSMPYGIGALLVVIICILSVRIKDLMGEYKSLKWVK